MLLKTVIKHFFIETSDTFNLNLSWFLISNKLEYNKDIKAVLKYLKLDYILYGDEI